MKRQYLFLPVLLLAAATSVTAQTYKRTVSGTTTEVTFYSPDIVRVTKYKEADKLAHTDPKFVVTMSPQDVTTQLVEGTADTIRSEKVTVVCSKTSALLSFYRADGTLLLKEKAKPAFTKRTSHTVDQYDVSQSFKLETKEPIYGFGQVQDGRLNHRGASYSHMVQSNMSVWMPYFQSVKGYGLYWDLYGPCDFTDSNSGGATFKTEGAHAVDYYLLVGSKERGDDVVQRVRELTGQATMVPLWTYGYFQSKERYESAMETLGVLKKYRSLKVPIDCVVQDWQYWGDHAHWNAMEFLNPQFSSDYQKMIDGVHEAGGHLLISIWANFGRETQQFAHYKEQNQLMKRGNDIMSSTWPNGEGVGVYSPYMQTARDYYWNRLNAGLVTKGVDAYWVDSSEPDHYEGGDNWETTNDFEVLHKDNAASATFNSQSTETSHTWRSVRNVFPLEHARGVYEGHRAEKSDLTEAKRVMIMTRSGYLGMQRYGAGTWSGDITASWETLAKQIPAAVNYSACGIPSWNSDIGGFFNGNFHGPGEGIYNELYVRWIQFGTFCTIMRSHGSATDRAIYQFGSEGESYYENIARCIRLRYALLPYIYSTGRRVHNEGFTFMRAMPMAYQTDANAHEVKDQFMFGEDVLVAPVVESRATQRSVYLPKGDRWTDFWTGEQHEGGTTVQKDVNLSVIPLYVRQGSILPWGPDVQYSEQDSWETLEVRVYPGADGRFVLYEDERDNYNYEQGQFSEIPFAWDEASQTLTIGQRQGTFEGMKEKRVFRLVLVDGERRMGVGPAQSDRFSKVVEYDGSEMKVVLDNNSVEDGSHSKLTGLKCNVKTLNIYPGQSSALRLTASFEDGTSRCVTLDATGESTLPEVVTMRDGIIYAGAEEGVADVTIRYVDNVGDSAECTVKVTVKLPSNIYKWKAYDWVKNRVSDRLSASDVKYSTAANTITITKTGAQNIALRYKEGAYLRPHSKYLCVVAQDVSADKNDSELWHLNSTWKGNTKATQVVKLKDGRVLVVWQFDELDAYTQAGETIFGLTSSNASGRSVISYVGFEESYTELAKQLNDIYTAIPNVSADASDIHHDVAGIYRLNGVASSHPQKGVNILLDSTGKAKKVLK